MVAREIHVPEPVKRQVTVRDVNERLEKLRKPLEMKLATLLQNERERSFLNEEQRITRLERILEGIYSKGFPQTEPPSKEQLEKELNAITPNFVALLLEAEYDQNYKFEHEMWERDQDPHYVSLAGQAQPMKSSASVVDDVFSKYFNTRRHAQ